MTSGAEPVQDARSGDSAAPTDEPQQAATPAVATPVQVGERFAWRANVQALWDAQDQAAPRPKMPRWPIRPLLASMRRPLTTWIEPEPARPSMTRIPTASASPAAPNFVRHDS